MKQVTVKRFATEAEALAFCDGLEFVNDSAISWVGPTAEGMDEGQEVEVWTVAVEDRDEDEDDGPTEQQISDAMNAPSWAEYTAPPITFQDLIK